MCLNHTQEAERGKVKWEKASSPPQCHSFSSLQQDSTFERFHSPWSVKSQGSRYTSLQRTFQIQITLVQADKLFNIHEKIVEYEGEEIIRRKFRKRSIYRAQRAHHYVNLALCACNLSTLEIPATTLPRLLVHA